MDDSKIVFINYVPGSFGSFLLKCLSASPSVFLRTTDCDFFDEVGASHYGIEHYLHKLHDPNYINSWVNLPDKQSFIQEQWIPDQNFVKSGLYYIHRLLVPKQTANIKSFFPNAKFIKITIPDKYIPVVIKMRNIKSSPIQHMIPSSGKYPKTVSWPAIAGHRNNAIIEGVYDFDISHFVENTFLQEFDRLCEWLNFDKVDVSEMYEKFKQLNGITNEE